MLIYKYINCGFFPYISKENSYVEGPKVLSTTSKVQEKVLEKYCQ